MKKTLISLAIASSLSFGINTYAQDVKTSSQIEVQNPTQNQEQITYSNFLKSLLYGENAVNITIGNIKHINDYKTILSNVVITKENGKKTTAKKIIIDGFNINKTITKNFNVKIKNLDNGSNITNLDFDYNYSQQELKFIIDSSFKDSKILSGYIDLNNVKLHNVKPVEIAKLIKKGTIIDFDLSGDLSEKIKSYASLYKEKLGLKDTINLDTFKLDYKIKLNKNHQMFINVTSKENKRLILNYNLKLKNVDFNGFFQFNRNSKFLNKIIVEQVKANIFIDLDIKKADLINIPSSSTLFNILNNDNVNLKFKFHQDYNSTDKKYQSNLSLSGKGLAGISYKLNGEVNKNLSLISYLNLNKKDTNLRNLYNCDNSLCVTNLNLNLKNETLIQNIVNFFDTNKTTTTEVKLKSYSLFPQLLALKQTNKLKKDFLFAISKFIQNPKEFDMNLTTKKPVSIDILINNIIGDSKLLNLQFGEIKLNFLTNLGDYFNVEFKVNGEKQ